MNTPLAEIGAWPGCDADVSGLLGIYQRTVSLHCDVRPEYPGKDTVLVSESALPAHETRSGEFSDDAQAALHLGDLDLLMVTTWEDVTPVYQVFIDDGEDITAGEGPLSAGVCAEFHTDASCVNGQCGTIKSYLVQTGVRAPATIL